MLPKYQIEFGAPFRDGVQTFHHQTQEAEEAERFLAELLERGFKIKEICHENIALSREDFDHMVKAAAHLLVSQHLCASLDLKPEEERFRFGFIA